jgi:hypothetical protein
MQVSVTATRFEVGRRYDPRCSGQVGFGTRVRPLPRMYSQLHVHAAAVMLVTIS